MFNEEYIKRHQEPEAKAPSGIALLDDLLNGGFVNGLYMLAGQPNIGKSTLMKQMADHISMGGQPVVYVTWDLTPSSYGQEASPGS
ncbi:hypothetical protein N6H14_30690 [Paenibacillus sp. CC-CFT747]|nr:hypothetical protein N6H14_30690 [Paenibacillus sp. CC-CFT747]